MCTFEIVHPKDCFNLLYLFILHQDQFPLIPLLPYAQPLPQSTPPLFLFRKGQASQGYK